MTTQREELQFALGLRQYSYTGQTPLGWSHWLCGSQAQLRLGDGLTQVWFRGPMVMVGRSWLHAKQMPRAMRQSLLLEAQRHRSPGTPRVQVAEATMQEMGL